MSPSLRLLLTVLVAAGHAGTACAFSGREDLPEPRVAVIYAASEDAFPENYRSIVAGIAENPDIRVYRIALGTDGDRIAQTTPRPAVKVQGLASDASALAVIYPDIGEPYRSIFTKIIEGIEESARTRVATIAVGANRTAADVAEELKRKDIKVVIALGRQGLKAASGLDRDVNVVASGVLSALPEDSRAMPVFSLTPDPSLLFTRLRALAPTVRRVHVVYEARQSSWLINLARDAARHHGLELMTYEAVDLKGAVLQYQEIFGAIDPKRDALWLPQDATSADEATILPLVLQESWKRNIAVFSSSVAHVRRGALFALYPNNVELGRNLGASALNTLGGGAAKRPGTTPLREVLTAVNLRTAGHLGLDANARSQNFDLVFPEP